MAELKQYIFFDFEMLCSNRRMPYEEMESIRLGAVKYDIQTQEVAYFDRYIRPKQLQPLSDFCKELTGIVDEDLVHADDFKVVMEDFFHWVGGIKRSRFFSWSNSDLTRLKIDARNHEIPNTTIQKIEKRYIDFQEIFTRRVSKTNMSVENALALYDLTFVGEKHNPMYDAYNTLRIYLNFVNNPLKTDLIMLKQFGFDSIANNEKLLNTLKHDIHQFLEELNDIYKLKDAKKMIKRTYKLISKYENILINRSGIFPSDITNKIRILNDFYQELVTCYQEHVHYSSKVMILHHHMVQPIRKIVHSI